MCADRRCVRLASQPDDSSFVWIAGGESGGELDALETPKALGRGLHERRAARRSSDCTPRAPADPPYQTAIAGGAGYT